MRKSIRVILFALSVLVATSIIIKAWWIYQHNYVCEPKARLVIDKFLDAVLTREYEALEDKSMFISKAQFREIKTKMSNRYTLTIKDWGGDGAAYTIVKFNNSTEYALMVVPNKMAAFSCWDIEYKVLTIR